MRSILLVGISLSALWVGSVGAKAANLVQNGGFESQFADWTLDGNILINYDYLGLNKVNHSGQFATIFGYNTEHHSMTQTLAMTAGTTYDVSFWINAVDPKGSNDPLCLSFAGAGSVCGTYENTNYAERKWKEISGRITATAASTLLEIMVGKAYGNPLIDDISVTAAVSAVPLPASMPLFGAGLLILGGLTMAAGHRSRRPDLTD